MIDLANFDQVEYSLNKAREFEELAHTYDLTGDRQGAASARKWSVFHYSYAARVAHARESSQSLRVESSPLSLRASGEVTGASGSPTPWTA